MERCSKSLFTRCDLCKTLVESDVEHDCSTWGDVCNSFRQNGQCLEFYDPADREKMLEWLKHCYTSKQGHVEERSSFYLSLTSDWITLGRWQNKNSLDGKPFLSLPFTNGITHYPFVHLTVQPDSKQHAKHYLHVTRRCEDLPVFVRRNSVLVAKNPIEPFELRHSDEIVFGTNEERTIIYRDWRDLIKK